MAAEVVEAPTFGELAIPREYVITQQGREYVLADGLLHGLVQLSRGFYDVATEIVQLPTAENQQMAVCTAKVTVFDPETGRVLRTATGIGDASPANVGRMVAIHCLRMAECVPLRAEILTRDGWTTWDKALIGQEVLSYDVETDGCRWTPLEEVSVFPEPAELVRLRSRSFDVTCTPDHTWAVRRYDGRAKRETRLLRKTRDFRLDDSLVVAAPAEGGDHPLTPRDAAVLGWVMTDGSLTWVTPAQPRMSVAQSKPATVAILRDLLGEDAREDTGGVRTRTFPAGNTSTCLPWHRFWLRASYVHRLLEASGIKGPANLPALVTRLSAPARAAMLEAMNLGDGHNKRGGASWVFAQKAKPGVMEAWELLATLEGKALGRPGVSSRGALPVRAARANRLISTAYLRREPVLPEPVWCPTTRYGTWVMRLDGTITITGNTRAVARALRHLLGVGLTALEELGQGGAEPVGDERLPAHSPGAPVRPSSSMPAVPTEHILIAGKPYTRQEVLVTYRKRLAEAQAAGLVIGEVDVVPPEQAPLASLVAKGQEIRRRLEARASA